MIRWNWRRGAARIPVTRIEIPHMLTPDEIVRCLAAVLVIDWESPDPLPQAMSRSAISKTVRERLLHRGAGFADEGWADEAGWDDAEIALAWAYQQFATAWPEHAEHVETGKSEFDSGLLSTYASESED